MPGETTLQGRWTCRPLRAAQNQEPGDTAARFRVATELAGAESKKTRAEQWGDCATEY